MWGRRGVGRATGSPWFISSVRHGVVLVVLVCLATGFAAAQTVEATFRILNRTDIYVGPLPNPAEPQFPFTVTASSTCTGDCAAPTSVGLVATITDRVAWNTGIAIGDPTCPPAPSGWPVLGDVDNVGVLARFFWFSIQQDGTGFPKIWGDIYAYEDLDLNTPSCTFAQFEAVSSWQTTGPVVLSPGVIFTRADQGDVLNSGTVSATTAAFIPANAATWAMGAPAPTPLFATSLTATAGTVDQKIVRLESDVSRIGRSPLYKYTFTLTNETDEELWVNWEAASIEVRLAPGEVYVETIRSRSPGREVQGYAKLDTPRSVKMTDPAISMIAEAIVPWDSSRRPSVAPPTQVTPQ